MFVDPIIMQFPENLDSENFVIATYYCATKPTTNMVKFAAALAGKGFKKRSLNLAEA